MSNIIMTAAAFADTLGVNVHISQGTANYGNSSDITTDLQYLGIWNLRDSYNPYWKSSYAVMAAAGAKFDFISAVGGTWTNSGIQPALLNIDSLITAVPGSVTAIEGPNEINNFPLTFNGVGGEQGAVDYQKALYSAIHADASLAGVVVYYFTGYNGGGGSADPDPATTPGLADYDTQHPYPNNGDPPFQWVNRTQALGNENPATGPAVYTETGYSSTQVGTTVQAKYTLDLLMDDAQNGIAGTDLYELMEEGDGYGLFDAANNPKPVATAIHNLTTILADRASPAASVTPATFSIGNLPSNGHDMALVKSTGATDIVVWNEPQISGTASGPSTDVTVALGGTYQTVKVFDPLLGATATQTLSGVSSVILGLTDHPLIVEVEPNAAPAPTPDTLTLRMSEDAWKGDAQFIVKVDGTLVGGTRTATALHSAGDANIFALTGNWGQGPQSVQIQFINDAYGGSAATDRNLYVGSIAYDGVTYSQTSKTMMSNGTNTFTVAGSTAAVSGPADTLTVHLSEDAWQGNAQFKLSIDGKPITTPQEVTALHSSGAWEDISFSGNFGAGSHAIGVSFINDTYGGTPTTDRNLYVNGISVDGQHYGNAVTTLLSNGTALFNVTTAH